MNVQLACLIRIRIFRYTLPFNIFYTFSILTDKSDLKDKQLHLFVLSNAEVSTVDS